MAGIHILKRRSEQLSSVFQRLKQKRLATKNTVVNFEAGQLRCTRPPLVLVQAGHRQRPAPPINPQQDGQG